MQLPFDAANISYGVMKENDTEFQCYKKRTKNYLRDQFNVRVEDFGLKNILYATWWNKGSKFQVVLLTDGLSDSECNEAYMWIHYREHPIEHQIKIMIDVENGYSYEFNRTINMTADLLAFYIYGSIVTPSLVRGCGPPPTPPTNGVVQLMNNNTRSGSNAIYTCHGGCAFIGTNITSINMTCIKEDMKWRGPTGYCPVVRCKPPDDIQNGIYWISGSKGPAVTYKCNPGFYLQGDKTRKCVCSEHPVTSCGVPGDAVEGNWSGEAPHCISSLSQPTPTISTTLSSSILLTMTTSAFPTVTPTVTPVKACEMLKNISSGSVMIVGTGEGATAHYTCDEGLRLEGDSIRQCILTNGKPGWTGSEPHCTCEMLKNISNGSVMIVGTGEGATAHYTCDEGLRLEGDSIRRCILTNGWTGSEPYCKGDIHLVKAEPSDQKFGLIEVYQDGEWKSVCDDYWTDIEAQVACRQLTFCSDNCKGAYATSRGEFKKDEEMRYALDNVNCRGNERSLFNCSYVKKHNCIEDERAGVACPGHNGPLVRLVDGNDGYSGIVEVFHDAEWRSVCDTHWTNIEAKVVCQELRLPFHAAVSFSGGVFREGQQERYWLDNVSCGGDETSLLECPHDKIEPHNCGQGQRAKVTCTPEDMGYNGNQ
jgi:hypothetical protein